MLENQYSGLTQRSKSIETSLIAWIISLLYMIVICIPLAIFIYTTIHVLFAIKDITKLINKTIKHAKAKFEPKSTQGLP
jgi:hypothetical protein